MPSLPHSLLSYLRVVAGAWRDDPREDAELLAHFADSGDEAAFRALVFRHGPMVWQTCRRILGDTPDAEDAFQTTFLALGEKARRLRRESLVGWLHRVARRAALKVGIEARRRRNLERQLRAATQRKVEENTDRAELYVALDEELAGLPERLRVPLLLHYLEGRSQVEVARFLGCGRSVLQRRLARGEAILRKRLERRGMTVGIGTVAALLTCSVAVSAVPTRLIGSTARAAVAFRSGALTGGAAEAARAVLRTLPSSTGTTIMRKSLGIVLACSLGLGGAALITCRALSARPDEPSAAGPTPAQASGQPEPGVKATTRLDCYGDPLPAGALARMGTTRLWTNYGNTSYPSSALAFSLDSKTLAAQGPGGTVCLWDAATGKEIRRLTDAGRFVSFSPDVQTLVTTSNERDIRLWEAATGKFLRELKYPGRRKQEEHLHKVAFLPNGKMLAVGEFLNARNDWRMYLRDVATGEEIIQRRQETRRIGAAAFSPDGKMLAADRGEGGGGKIHLWDVATGKEILQLTHKNERNSNVSAVVFSPDGKTLASYARGTACVWEVATGKKVHQLSVGEFGTAGNPLLFSPDGKTLVGGGCLWDMVTGQKIRSFGWLELDGDCVRVAAFSPDGKILATGEPQGVIRLWEVATGKEISPRKGHQGRVNSLAYSPDGKTLVSASHDRTVGLWEVDTGKEIRRLPRHEGWGVYSVTYSPAGKLLASADGLKGYLWEAATGKKIREFPNPREVIAFSPDSKVLATGKQITAEMLKDCTHAVSLWDLATGKEIHSLLTGQDDDSVLFWTIAFSPDSRILASTGKHDTVTLWEMATGKPIGQLNLGGQEQGGPSDRMVSSFAFSPDSRILAAAMRPGDTASLWEVASGKKIRQLKGLKGNLVSGSGWSFTFSPDGRMLASAGGEDRKVHLWEVATGKEIGRLSGHQSSVRTVVFSPDGKTLASGSDDTTCLVWDATSFAGRLKPVAARSRPSLPLTKEQLEAAWKDLAKDAAKAFAAIGVLQGVPTQAAALLRARIPPVAPPADPQQLKSWIADLDNGSFTVRDKARREIEKLGELALPAVQQALKSRPSLEAKRRLQDLLTELEPKLIVDSPRRLRELRAVQVLESIGTTEARQLLQAWANGAGGARLTVEAEAALVRLAKRPVAGL